MGDGYTSSFGLNRKPLSPRLGEELRLELDPRLQIWMGRMLNEGDLGRARTYALRPDWKSLGLEDDVILRRNKFYGWPMDPARVPVFSPLATGSPPVCPRTPDPPEPRRGEPAKEPKEGDLSDVLEAVSEKKEWVCAVTQVFDPLERFQRDWRRLGTGERIGLITTAVTIGVPTLALILANEENRKSALGKAIGIKLPVPYVPGLGFQFNSTQSSGLPEKQPFDDTPIDIFFTLDVPTFLQNFQRTPSYKLNY